MVYGSRQGVNIAFVGVNQKAQVACAEYLKHVFNFKRMEMDDLLRIFLRNSYSYASWKNISIKERRKFYDALYRVDPNIFIEYIKSRVDITEKDTVIHDVRYMNEMRALQEMGFKIVRVTAPSTPEIGVYVTGASEGTTALAMLYDKNFASNHEVDYSIHYTLKSKLPQTINPLLRTLGYNLE